MAAHISIIIPTYNGALRISNCIESLLKQSGSHSYEILVVNDGSTDNTIDVLKSFPSIQVITQLNTGPAAARNRGAREARGEILLFTDDDCVPMSDWITEMLRPFTDAAVVGAKGIYRTHQRGLAARFVQIEYEDRYRIMQAHPDIDFIDTYSAAFRRDRFLEMNGYDTSFPVACAEDIELSYRMSARGWKMRFSPTAIVYHSHPDTFSNYLKKKYKFAFWRMLAVKKNPGKAVKDSHTPQIMKAQLLFGPGLVIAILFDFSFKSFPLISLCICTAFLASTLPFAIRAARKDLFVGVLSPAILALRSFAQFLGVFGGLINARRQRPQIADRAKA
jgi:GT2 family glycosyltransferase